MDTWSRNDMTSKLIGTILPKKGSQKQHPMGSYYLDFQNCPWSFQCGFSLILREYSMMVHHMW